jgi:hypothetical protein
MLYVFLLFTMHATCPAHPPCFHHPGAFGEEQKLWSSSFCSCPRRAAVCPSLFGPTVAISTLFSNTFSLCSSINVRNRVSDAYLIAEKICMLIFNDTFYIETLNVKDSERHGMKYFGNLTVFNIFKNVIQNCYRRFQKL